MAQKSEMWLSFAGGELTCTVKESESIRPHSLDVVMTGTITPSRDYSYDLIMSVIEHTTSDIVHLDARELEFFSEHTVNDCAIDSLLKFVGYFSKKKRRLIVTLEDGCVKDVLGQGLHGQNMPSVSLSS